MRTLCTLILAILSSGLLLAQDILKTKEVPTTYDRSSITVLFIDNASANHWSRVRSKIDSVRFSDKYDNNNINQLYLEADGLSTSTANRQKELTKELESLSIGRQIIAKWYNRKSDGTMDMELVHQRGRFSATDADFLMAQTSKRGNAMLEEFGNRLINLSYVLIVDIQEIKTASEADMKSQRGWQATSNGYLYKVNFNDEIRDAFYETWIYDDDSDEVKKEKRRAFQSLNIPLTPVMQSSVRVSAMQPEGDSNLGMFFKPKTTDQLMAELAQKAYDELIYRIEMGVEDFKVKTPLYATRPLRAKIGLKEGLKTDNRFFVYEHVYNPKTNQAEPKRRGIIRASSKSKIVDNRRTATGDMEMSRFYQVSGRRLHPGYTLQQQNDFGLEVSAGAEIGEIGGLYLRADYRSGRQAGIRALFTYGEFGYQYKKYPLFSSDGMHFIRFGVGFAKGLQFSRNIEIRPYIGIGGEQASNSNYTGDDALTAYFLKPGVNLALNLKYNLQIVGGSGAYLFVTSGESKNGANIGKWSDAFQDRGGASTFMGIKLGF
jgi:hypothetical protein